MDKTSDSNIQAAEDKAVTKPEKDKWDIISILARPISAIVTALAIAAIGYYGQQVVNNISARQEKARQQIAHQEQDARLYTQLLSRREESESALRKDMFKEIMTGFFSDLNVSDKKEFNNSNSEKVPKGSIISNDISNKVLKRDIINNIISKKILKLEMLALNFGDSLSLGPLFSELSKDIDRILEANKIKDWMDVSELHQKRLRSLAKRVASAQLATIIPKGKTFDIDIPYEKIKKPDSGAESEEWQFTWPYDLTKESRPENNMRLNEINRSLTIQMRNADFNNKAVSVKLLIEDLVEDTISYKGDTEITFTLDYFNFPLIDNTRLSDNERFAIVLEKFTWEKITIKCVLFDGVYASQRDKPFLNEAIHELKVQQNAEHQQNSSEVNNEQEAITLNTKSNDYDTEYEEEIKDETEEVGVETETDGKADSHNEPQ